MKTSLIRLLLLCSFGAGLTHAYALRLDPIRIYSSVGQVLSAEIAFSHANPQDDLEVETAETDALDFLQLTEYNQHAYRYSVQRQALATHGVITLSSDIPLKQPQLKLLVKIKHGDIVYYQQLDVELTSIELKRVELNAIAVKTPEHSVDQWLTTPQPILRAINSTHAISEQIEHELEQLNAVAPATSMP